MGKRLEKAPGKDPKKILGFGAPSGLGAGQIISLISQACSGPTYALPVIWESTWYINGPLSHNDTQSTFGSQIDILDSTNTEGIADITNTPGLNQGEFQTYMLICAIGVHARPEPLCWTARGNAVNFPTANAPNKPFSPDAFTAADFAANNPQNTFPLQPGTVPAVLEWGWWLNYAIWYLARGYNLRWTFGSLMNILDEELRNTLYMPPNAQEGSASSSLVDVNYFASRVNTQYANLTPAANLLFSIINAHRVGSVNGLINGGSVFEPNRDDEFVEATYGGMDLRSALRGNSEYRVLANAFLAKPGVKLGLIFEENDTQEGNIMRSYLDVTQCFGGTVPPIFSEAGWPNGFASNNNSFSEFAERTIDGFTVPQQTYTGRAIFKGGTATMSVLGKGYELSDTLAETIKGNADLQAQLRSEIGCMCGWA